jgi:hypothetical protein
VYDYETDPRGTSVCALALIVWPGIMVVIAIVRVVVVFETQLKVEIARCRVASHRDLRAVRVFLDPFEYTSGKGDGDKSVIEVVCFSAGRIYVAMPRFAPSARLHAAASGDGDDVSGLKEDLRIIRSVLSRIGTLNSDDIRVRPR